MKLFALAALVISACPLFGQVATFPPSGGSGGVGAPNQSCSFASGASGCTVNTTLLAVPVTALSMQCYTGPPYAFLASTNTPSPSSGNVTSVAFAFSAAPAAGYCVVNGTGSAGSQGPQGNAGSAGTPGYSPQYLVGSGAPSNSLGNNLDMYINSLTGDVYGPKASGAWPGSVANIKGPAGTPGSAGYTPQYLIGAGAPNNSLGNNSDMYINSSTGDIYGPKASGAWPGSAANIKGPSGAAGAAGTPGYTPIFIVAAGVPSNGVGNNSDMYINSSNGDIYGPKTAGSWGSSTSNIRGPAGNAGSNGTPGYTPAFIVASGVPSSGTGNNSDMYINSATGDVYGPKTAGSWGSAGANLKGPAGSGGGSTASTAVTSSSTPAFTIAAGNVIQALKLTLTSNAAPVLNGTSAQDGQLVPVQITQPASGSPFTVTWPSNMTGFGTIDPTLGSTSSQFGRWDAATSKLVAQGTMSSDAGTPHIVMSDGLLGLPSGVGNPTLMSTVTSVLPAQLPALTGDCSTAAGANTVTCGAAIARRGVDLNSSDQVAATHLAAPLPFAQGGVAATTAPAAASNLGVAPGTISTPIVVTPASGELNTVLAAAGANAVLTLNPGTYNLTTTAFPLAGQSIVAQPGVVIKGSKTLSAWTAGTNGNWYATGQTDVEASAYDVRCDGTRPCLSPTDLFYDWSYSTVLGTVTNAAPLIRDLDCTGSPTTLISGHWCLDPTAHYIYIHQTPVGHVLERDVLPYAFGGDNPNVTLKGLVFAQFSSPIQVSCVGAGINAGSAQADGWHLINVNISGCHGAGFRPGGGNNVLVEGGSMHHNGQEGGGGYLGSNAQWLGVDFSYNNYAGFSGGFECGGAKWTGVIGLVVRNSKFLYNTGQGFWEDGSNTRATVIGNQMIGNRDAGAQLEVSHSGIFEMNFLSGNSTVQLFNYNSDNWTVNNNTIQAGSFGSGLTIQNDARGFDPNGIPFLARANRYFDNDLTMLAGGTAYTDYLVILTGNNTAANVLTPAQNLFRRNHYHMANPDTDPLFVGVAGGYSKYNWQASGRDVDGSTFDSTYDGSTSGNNSHYTNTLPNPLSYVVPNPIGDVTLDLDNGTNQVLNPTGPITGLHVVHMPGNTPFSITVNNGATVQPITPDLFWTGFMSNSASAANTQCVQQFQPDSSYTFINATPALCSQTSSYLTADDFNGNPGDYLNNNYLRVRTGNTWVDGYSTGGAHVKYASGTGFNGAVNNGYLSSAFSSATLPTGGYTVMGDFVPANTPSGTEIFGVIASQGTLSDNTVGYIGRWNAYVPGIEITFGDHTLVSVPMAAQFIAGYKYRFTLNVITSTGNDLKLTVQEFNNTSTNGYYATSGGAWSATPGPAIAITGDTSQSATGSAGIYLRQNSGANTQATSFGVLPNH